ncbi:MAG: CRTAC1 family protein [Calditrichota bacterium]
MLNLNLKLPPVCFLIISSLGLTALLTGCAYMRPAREPAPRLTPLQQTEMLIRRGCPDSARVLYKVNQFPEDSASLSLYAGSYEAEANWKEAALAWQRAQNMYPQVVEFNLHYWQCLLAMAREDTTLKDSLHQLIREEGLSFAAGESADDLHLAYNALSSVHDSTAEGVLDRLIALHPESELASNYVGSRFWDGLYPIWNDNPARVKYMTNFMEKYSAYSWKHLAWRYLISIKSEMKDTAGVVDECLRWVKSAPEDPLILSAAASFLLELNGPSDSVHAWIDRAGERYDQIARPQHYTKEEWQLYAQSSRASIPLLRAELAYREKEYKEALHLVRVSFEEAIYGVDEYATCAPQYELLGRILLALGDTTQAARSWVEALSEGDVRNFYAGRADSSLRAVLNLDSTANLSIFGRILCFYNSIQFTDVTADVGLSGLGGSRFAWGDYDGDGYDDLLVSGSRLFRNSEGTFTEVTQEAGLTAPGCHGGVWGDYDNDGRIDLFCFSSSSDINQAERLFHNEGNGTFSDKTGLSSDLPDSFSTEAAIWVDVNNDGRLDLYIAGYERPYNAASDMGGGWPDRLLVQDQDGVFHNETEPRGIIPPRGQNLCGRSPVACDFDLDGDQDIYVGNYRLQQNLFWINDGAGHFTDQAAWFKVDGEQVDGWWGHSIGCQWGDFDNDGDFDIVVGNLAHPRYIRFSNRTMLYRNDGYQNGFTDVRKDWGIKYDECHSEPIWGDLDNDGDLDLFMTSVYPGRRSYLYRNDRDHFTDVTFMAGARIFNGWGCALADYDRDGDLDLITKDEDRVVLLRNDTKGGAWFELDILGQEGGNVNPIGVVVKAETNKGTYLRQIEGGKGAGSQSSGTIHFGLGDANKVKLTIIAHGKELSIFKGKINTRAKMTLPLAK